MLYKLKNTISKGVMSIFIISIFGTLLSTITCDNPTDRTGLLLITLMLLLLTVQLLLLLDKNIKF